jgi:hypothetical protein
MKIESHSDLTNLHRCLIEAKFNPNPVDPHILFSPIIAKFANECLDELNEVTAKKYGAHLVDAEWRNIEGHPGLIQNLKSAMNEKDLNSIPTDSIDETITDACAPFKVSKQTIKEIRDYAFKR